MALNWFKKLKSGLSKSASKVEGAIASITGKKTLDQESLDDIAEGDADCVWKAVTNEVYKGWHDAVCSLESFRDWGELHALCEFDLTLDLYPI